MKSDFSASEAEIDSLLRKALEPDREPDAAVQEALRRKLAAQWEGESYHAAQEKSDSGRSDIREFTHGDSCGKGASDGALRNNNRRIVLDMKTEHKKKVAAAAVSVACVLAVSVSAVAAASKYLTRDEIIQEMQDPDAASTFENGNVLEVNQTQEAGDYIFTLYGIATNETLADSEMAGAIQGKDGSTYAVVAIAKKDGTPMPSTSSDEYSDLDFFVSPLIQGLTPWWYNIAAMGGSYGQIVRNGVLYRVIECDDIAIFADRKLYLCIIDSVFYRKEAFNYNEEDGTITRNEFYKGINVLFDLPIDSALADPEKAAEYVRAFNEPTATSAPANEDTAGTNDQKENDQVSNGQEETVKSHPRYNGHGYNPETKEFDCPVVEKILRAEWEKGNDVVSLIEIPDADLIKYGTLLEESVQVLTMTEEGTLQYSYRSDEHGGWKKTFKPEMLEEQLDARDGVFVCGTGCSYGASEVHHMAFNVVIRDEDGTVKGMMYVMEGAFE